MLILTQNVEEIGIGDKKMSNDDQIQTLQKQLEELSRQVGILQDEQAVRKLQHSYGYYLDKCLYNEVVDLFAEDSEVRFMRGVFKGKSGVKRLYLERFGKNFTGGKNGPMFGFLLDHPQYQDIVDVAPDRKLPGRGSVAACRPVCITVLAAKPGSGGKAACMKTPMSEKMASGKSRCSITARCSMVHSNTAGPIQNQILSPFTRMQINSRKIRSARMK